MDLAWHEPTLRIGLAMLLGAAIGLERQLHQRTAGLRTNALVAIGSAAFVLFGGLFPGESSPTRVAAQIVSGIGFLGAGVIMREGLNVRGLNTAATLWCSAAVGAFCGGGMQLEAAMTTIFVIGCHLVLRPLSRVIDRQPFGGRDEVRHFELCVTCSTAELGHIRGILINAALGNSLTLTGIQSQDQEGGLSNVTAFIDGLGRGNLAIERLTAQLALESAVNAARWELAHPRT